MAEALNSRDVVFKCRKCRTKLFTGSFVVDAHSNPFGPLKEAEQQCESLDNAFPVWFLSEASVEEKYPDWIQLELQWSNFFKGKFNCRKCNAHVGSFDFVYSRKCQCLQYTLPAVRIVKSKVDCLECCKNPSFSLRPKLDSAVTEVTEKHETECSKETPDTHTSTVELPTTLEQCVDDRLSLQFHKVDLGSSSGHQPHGDNPTAVHKVNLATKSGNATCRVQQEINLRTSVSDCTAAFSPKLPTHANDEGPVSGLSSPFAIGLGTLESSEGTLPNRLTENQPRSAKPATPGTDEYPEEITCSVCLDLYHSPFICYPCTHVFCEICLRRLAQANPQATKCPLCRQLIGMCLPDSELSHRVRAIFPRNHVRARQRLLSKMRNHPLPWQPHYHVRHFLTATGRFFLWGNVRTLSETFSTISLLIGLHVIALFTFFIGYHGCLYVPQLIAGLLQRLTSLASGTPGDQTWTLQWLHEAWIAMTATVFCIAFAFVWLCNS